MSLGFLLHACLCKLIGCVFWDGQTKRGVSAQPGVATGERGTRAYSVWVLVGCNVQEIRHEWARW